MCLVAFQKMFRKIFSNVWLCSWKYHRKHIFYLLLTFSRLPNKYIISFIPQNTNKTQKKIIKSGQTKVRSRLARSRLQSMHLTIAIDAFAVPMMSALRRPRCRWCRRTARCRWCHDLFFLSLSLSSIFQGRKSFEVKMETEMIFRCFGSEIQSTENAFQFDRIWSNNQTPHFPENHFRNQFEINSNAALNFLILHSFWWLVCSLIFLFLIC